MYEVAWTRLLTLQMGHTVAAASTVLAAFMGGLAVGAGAASRLRSAWPRLRVYAALELVVAAVALALPALLAACVPALRWAYTDGDAALRFALVRVAVSLILLGVPAAAMGATFPIAAEWYTDRSVDAGALYAANTAGAALGAIAAGFFLIPAIGLRTTTFIAAALNVGAAVTAWQLTGEPGTRHTAPGTAAPGTTAPGTRHPAPGTTAPGTRHPAGGTSPAAATFVVAAAAYVATATCGFVALVFEVAWTRLLALVIGPTTYAFATMVASVVTGLAIGSALGTRVARRSPHDGRWLSAAVAAAGAAGCAAAWLAATRLPLAVAAQVADPNAAFARIVVWQASVVLLLLMPATIALGAAFPLALALADTGSSVGTNAGRVYAANTVGAIAGALAGGFALLPTFGLQTTFRAAAVASVIVGAAIWFATALVAAPAPLQRRASAGPPAARLKPRTARSSTRTPRDIPDVARGFSRAELVAAAAIFAAVGAGLLLLPPWDRSLLASGAYKYAPYVRGSDLETALTAGQLEYYKEGAAATVSVRRLAGTLSLAVDGKVDASNAGDMLTQRLLGLLPVLMHERPREVCVIGLGSGVTLESTLATGRVARADVVEISPEVVAASDYFANDNANVLRADNVHPIVGDGRSHLLLTRRRYDVIVSEPSNPWMAGVAALFTSEFFHAARARLAPDGLLCQWAHTYDISDRDLRSIVRTFASVFPQGTMWLVGPGDLLMIGTNGDAIAPHLANIAANLRLGSAAAMLASVSDQRAFAPGFQLLSLFAGGPDELARYGDAAAIQRDDRMALEFSAPLWIYGRVATDNAANIRAAADRSRWPATVRTVVDTATGVSWTARGLMELKAEAYGIAYDDLRRAIAMMRDNPVALEAALHGLSEAAAGAGRQSEEREWLTRLAKEQPGNVPVHLEVSRILAARGDYEGALASAETAVRLAPDNPSAAEQLASVLADAGDGDRLGSLADAMLAHFPGRDEAHYFRATALFLKGRTAEAVDEARRFVDRHPAHVRAQNLLGAACGTLGRRDCAMAAFAAALRANPRESSTYVNIGVFRLQSGDATGAAAAFAEALAVDPESSAARNGLAQARAALVR